jgi:flagellar hook-length control protein FliK
MKIVNFSREAFVSVTVGFSPATTSLIAPAAGATRPDGTPVEGGAEAGGAASLFAALMAMLAPGALAPTEADPANAEGIVAPPAVVGTPPVSFSPPAVDAAESTPTPQDLLPLAQSPEGKALLKDLTDALKAARTALDEGKPIEPALAKKLKAAVDAVAAWFAGQPQLQAPAIDATKLSELAAADNLLPAAPGAELPLALPADAPAEPPEGDDTSPALKDVSAPVGTSPAAAPGSAPQTMEALPVPPALADFGKALDDFASSLEGIEPTLAASLKALADRVSVGDISDDALTQLGLTRTTTASSPQIDQLVAAVATPAATKPAATRQSPIAPAILDLPESLAETPPVAAGKSETTKGEPKPEQLTSAATARTDVPASSAAAEPNDVDLGATVKLEAKPAHDSDDTPAADDSKAPPLPAGKGDGPSPSAASADAASQVAQAAATNATTAARAIHAAYASPVQQINVPQVAFEVVRQFEAGNTKFQIRLDPADLGRIDVSLDMDKHGTVNARMFVERPETLDLMMRDQRALQQALQQAGLDTGKTNLEFSLRQNPFAGGGDMGQNGGNGSERGFGPFGTPQADEPADLPAQTLYRGSASQSGLNLFV